MSEMYNALLPCVGLITVATAIVGYLLSKSKNSLPNNNKLINEMNNIASLIRNGGFKCLNAQYMPAVIITGLLCTFLKFSLGKTSVVNGIIAGFASCIACVYFCFMVAMSGNIATAVASTNSIKKGFRVSYMFSKSVGLFVLGTSVFVLSIITFPFLFHSKLDRFEFMLGTGIGVSIVSLFARLAGGIFTKGADIGADLVGKVLKDIPEDDPRNPGTIADNIGDNIGDCVGTAADIHETFILAFVSILSTTSFSNLMIPLLSCVLGSVISVHLIGFYKIKESETSVLANTLQMIVHNIVISTISFFALSIGYNWLFGKALLDISLSVIAPFLVGIAYVPAIFAIVNYYTAKTNKPVRLLAEACQDGAAMNVIAGYALSLQAAFITISFATVSGLLVYQFFGMNGLMVMITTSLGFIGTVMTMDTYGPITDNAGGIVTMAGAPNSTRENTDALDSIGNLTKALTKGYSSGITILTSFMLLKLFFNNSGLSVEIQNPVFLFGIFLGAAVPFVFSGLVIQSVYKAAQYMLQVIQKLIVNLSPTDTGYYTYPIQSLSNQSVRSMIMPIISVGFPILIAFAIGYLSNNLKDRLYMVSFLSGSLIGTCVTGLLLSVCMTIGGAIWDNAKKLVEESVGQKIKLMREKLENEIGNTSSDINTIEYNLPFDQLKNIQISLDELTKLKVTEADEKASVFDTFKKAMSTHTDELKTWIDQNEACAHGNHVKDFDFKACFEALKEGTNYKAKDNIQKIFSMYGDLEKLKSIKDASVIGDMLGDPLKDAAGTGLNSMVKFSLMIYLSLLLIFNL